MPWLPTAADVGPVVVVEEVVPVLLPPPKLKEGPEPEPANWQVLPRAFKEVTINCLLPSIKAVTSASEQELAKQLG